MPSVPVDKKLEKHDIEAYAAVDFFAKNVYRYGRIWRTSKRRCVSINLDYTFGRFCLSHLFFHTNYIVCRSPKIAWIDERIVEPLVKLIRLDKVFYAYQRLVFNIVTYLTIRKFPNVKGEICHLTYFAYVLYDWTKNKIK